MTENEFEKFATNLGEVIDMDYDEFTNKVEDLAIPVGVLQNLRVVFLASYNNLVERKNAIIDGIKNNTIENNEETHKIIEGIYAELLKIEDKSTYLVQRISKLLDI